MARQPRYALAHQPQHVIQRGNDRQSIFRAEADYRFFLEKLLAAAEKHGCAIHAYVLMTNHVHLLASPQEEGGIGWIMQMVGRYYVQYFNYCYRRTGTLWEGRYRATLIDSEQYLLTCMRYIELNPVRANNMAAHPSEYPWSSYRNNALGELDALVTPHPQYRRLGRTDAERQAAYRQLFRERIPNKMLDEIRAATNKAWVLGNDRFKQTLASRIDRRPAPVGRGGDHKSETYRQQAKINRV
jgi:putative transposase